jgi:hypothetical protein
MSGTLSLVLPYFGAVAVVWGTPGLCSSTWTPLNSFTSRARLAAVPVEPQRTLCGESGRPQGTLSAAGPGVAWAALGCPR